MFLHAEKRISWVWFVFCLQTAVIPMKVLEQEQMPGRHSPTFLENIGSEDTSENASAKTRIQANRVRLLKQLLTNCANLNCSVARGLPLWVAFMGRLLDGKNNDSSLSHYLEIIELLLCFETDPNQKYEVVCSCCMVFVPWKHFLAGLGDLKTQSFQRQEFLAHLCVMMLEHSADPTVRLGSRGGRYRHRSVIESAFTPGLAGPILAALPLLQTLKSTENTSHEDNRLQKRRTITKKKVSSLTPPSSLGMFFHGGHTSSDRQSHSEHGKNISGLPTGREYFHVAWAKVVLTAL